MSKTKADDLCQVRCFNTELVTQIRSTLPNEDTLEESKIMYPLLLFAQFSPHDYRLAIIWLP